MFVDLQAREYRQVIEDFVSWSRLDKLNSLKEHFTPVRIFCHSMVIVFVVDNSRTF